MIQLSVITAAPIPAAAEPTTVRTRDGVELATDVYLPEGAGPFPAVLTRLPYDKASPLMAIEVIASVYTARGYAFVAQDVRGRFRSEGATYPFVSEIADTYDVIDWLVSQPWSDGRVGMTGDSYHGYTQWAGVAGRHPALRAIAPRVTGTELSALDRMARTDEHLVPLYMANYYAHYWVDRNENLYDTDWSVRPLFDAFEEPFALIGARSAVIDDARASGGTIQDPFDADDPFDREPIPVLHRVGWADNLIDMSMRDYERQRATPGWRDHAYLDADSCDHYSYRVEDGPATPETDHGADDAAFARMLPRYLGRTIDFFDVFVAGIADPSEFPRVSWRQSFADDRVAEQWPPAGSTTSVLRLSRGDLALHSADGGLLSVDGSDERVSWTHDPADPVPSTVVNPFVFAYEYPDEAPVQSRRDVATFTGAAVEAPVDLTGPVRVILALSSDAPSVDAHVKLADVAPDGSARMILRGQSRVHGGGQVDVDLGHTGYRIRPGHRLRLQIAASDFPLYAPNPGTGEKDWEASSYRAARVELDLRGAELRITTSPMTRSN